MNKTLLTVLLGTSLLVPAHADAQRGSNRARVTAPRAVRVSGRLNACRPASRAQPFDCPATVVYSSGLHGASAAAALWVRTDWGRVRMRTDFRFDRRGVLNQRQLRDVLGRRTVDRVRNEGRRLGLRGALRGRWHQAFRFGDVLVVTMGGVEVAEFADYDGDGFIDEVLVPRRVRGRRIASRLW